MRSTCSLISHGATDSKNEHFNYFCPAPACFPIKLIRIQKIALSGVNYWKSSTGTVRQTWKAKQSYACTKNFEWEIYISILCLVVMFESWYVFNMNILRSMKNQARNFKKTKFKNLHCKRMLLNSKYSSYQISQGNTLSRLISKTQIRRKSTQCFFFYSPTLSLHASYRS